MPAILLSGQFQTILAPTAAAQQVTLRDRWVMMRNIGANFVQIANISPTGENVANTAGTAQAAGNRTTVNPAPLTGQRDFVMLKPFNVYLIQATSADTLVAFEEIGSPVPTDSGA